MNILHLDVTARGDLESLELGTGATSSTSSLQTLPSTSDSSITAAYDDSRTLSESRSAKLIDCVKGEKYSCPKYRNVPKFEEKTDLQKYPKHIDQQRNAFKSQIRRVSSSMPHGYSAPPIMGYDVYGPKAGLTASSVALASDTFDKTEQHQSNRNNFLDTIPEDFHLGYRPSDIVNIKEIGLSRSNKVSLFPRATSKLKSHRKVHFAAGSGTDVLSTSGLNTEDYPIPCNPIDCPETRLALENARLKHSLSVDHLGAAEGISPSQTTASYRRSRRVDYYPNESSPRQGPSHHPHLSSYPNLDEGQMRPSPGLISNARSPNNSRAPCSSGLNYRNSSTLGPWQPSLLAPINNLSNPPLHIAEVEGDIPFHNSNIETIENSVANMHVSQMTPVTNLTVAFDREGDLGIYRPNHERFKENYEFLEASELFTPGAIPKKSKEILRKIWGSRNSRSCESGFYPFTQKIEYSRFVQYTSLEARKEWAFVAISPDSKTIVGVGDHDIFITYSMDNIGITQLTSGEFEGEPLTIAVSNTHLAILTLVKLQVFDHHSGRKVYEWASDKTVTMENFTSIVFSNSSLELCVGLTNGTIQFHFIITPEDENYDHDDVDFHRGDPKMDISLGGDDYAFAMSFSDDDMRFACGTQRRMLLVYEFRGPAGWELRNKFKFSDFEPGTHRRISGALFCADNRFLFATTTSGRSSAYMYCIDGNKQSKCPQSISYPLAITKKGISRSALSPNGKSIALIDGDGIVYKCDFGPGAVLSERQEFAKLHSALIPARACWISWTSSGELVLLDKKGHLRVYDLAGERTT